MRPLYEIIEDIENCIDEETGEIDEESLDALNIEYADKVESVSLAIKNLAVQVDGMDAEKKRLEQRIKVAKNQSDRLKQWLHHAIKELQGWEKFETPKVKVSFRRSESVEIPYEDMVPDSFCEFETKRKPNKAAIKAAIKSGEVVPGASLVEKENTQIK